MAETKKMRDNMLRYYFLFYFITTKTKLVPKYAKSCQKFTF